MTIVDSKGREVGDTLSDGHMQSGEDQTHPERGPQAFVVRKEVI